MRKLAAACVFVFAVILAIVWLTPEKERAPWDLTKNQIAYYNLKRSGKPPKLKRRPNQEFYEQRAYPYDEIPKEQYLEALDEGQDARAALNSKRAVTWESVGPTNIPGRITDIASHPVEFSTVYAGAAAGGVFKSNDKGISWTAIFDDVGTYSIGAIAIDPNDRNTIYVGTGEPSAAIDDYEGNGVYKSIDAGDNWTYVGLDSTALIGRIVIDPLHPDTVYVAALGKVLGSNRSAQRGVYRSENGGISWDRILFVDSGAGCVDIALHPSTGTVFAAIWDVYEGPLSALWRSSDHGDTWEMLSGNGGGLPAPANTGRIGVTVDPQSNTVYSIHIDGSSRDLMGLYKSTDLGNTWTRTNDGVLDGTFGGFGWYFGQVRVAPGNPDLVYSLGVQLYRSSDGGNSWENVTYESHVDHHAMWIHPYNSAVVYGGCDGGVYFKQNNDPAWNVRKNMPNTQFYAITVDPNNADKIYGGTQDNGTMRTLTGSTDDWTEIYGGDGFYCIVDHTNSDIMYAESQYGNLSKSTDGGYNWYWAQNGITPSPDEPHGWSTPVVMDPNNHLVLYYGTDRVYRTSDGADLWTAISPSLSARYLTTIGVSAIDDQVVYAGSRDGAVWGTTDGGANWDDLTAGLPDRWVTRLTPDPFTASRVYVTLSGYITDGSSLPHVFRSDDYGATWSDISSNLPDAPVNDLLVDPMDEAFLYAGTDVGVFVSPDTGATWALLGTGMPVTCIADLEIHENTRKIVAGTHGRSMFQARLDCPDTTDSDGDGVGDLCDNCPLHENADQADIDGDNIGDACDDCVDPDNDGYGSPGYPMATCDEDNCPDTYNPGQADFDGDGEGDACEAAAAPASDTISSSCLSLQVSNDGNAAAKGTANMTLDYALEGDCESKYLYDGGPVVVRRQGTEYVADYNIFNAGSFTRSVTGTPMTPTTDMGGYQIFSSGTFITADGHIALEQTWYAPQNADSCQFMITAIKVYSWAGVTDTNLYIGFLCDWDVPSEYESDNEGYVDATYKLLYQRGIGVGCDNNTFRYAGLAMLGIAWGDSCMSGEQPHGAYVADNAQYVYPTGSLVPQELYNNMSQTGYSVFGEQSDLHSVITALGDYTLTPDDTLTFYMVLSTIRFGDADDLVDNILKARKWASNHIIGGCSCCTGPSVGNVDGSPDNRVTIGDLTVLIDHLFISLVPLQCVDEGNIDMSPDGQVTMSDLTVLIDHLFISLDPLSPCP